LKLDKPINFIDVEASGLDVAMDRVCALAIVTAYPGGGFRHLSWMFNPQVEMGPDVIAVHGITNEMVKDKPLFGVHAGEIHKILDGVDVGGFNVRRFDAPILWEELYRCGITWEWTTSSFVDVGNIFKKREPRDLSAAVKFYCGREHKGAHGAAADVEETMEVLKVMVPRYGLESTVAALAQESKMDDNVDLAGKIVRDRDGDPCYAFGKVRFNTKNRTGLKLKDEPGLAQWALDRDFPAETKMVIRRLLTEIYRQAEEQGDLELPA
jgi:DNA polymerase-3 subunit epsilon